MTAEQALERYAERRDAQAFRLLVERYQGLVYSAASRVLARREDVEDVTQQTFLKLAQGAGSIRENVGAWLYTTAVHGATDRIRRNATRRRHEGRVMVERGASGRAEWGELSGVMDEEIARLPADARGLIVAHFLEGESHRAIAERTGVNQSTVSRRIEAAVESLRRNLARRGFGEIGGGIGAVLAKVPNVPVPAGVTGELMKVGLAGMGAATGTAAMGVIAALVVVLVTVCTVWLLHRPRSPAGIVAPAIAPPPATVPTDEKSAMAELQKSYALASDETLRRVLPPFPPAREAVLRAMNPGSRGIDRILQMSVTYYFGSRGLQWGGTGPPSSNAEGFANSVLRVEWFHREDFSSIDWKPGNADWIVRGSLMENEEVGKRLQAWAIMLSHDLTKEVTFASTKVTRPCIVMHGRHRLPDYQDRHGMHPVVVSVAKLSPEEMLAAKKRGEAGNGDYRFDFDDVGELLDAPFFGSYVGEIFYILPDAHLDHTQPGFKEDLQKVLDNVKDQVGCEWKIEDREIEVWHPVVK